MKINDFVSLYKPKIKNALVDYLTDCGSRAPADLPYFLEVVDGFRRFAPDGKLFRGLLVIIGSVLTGQRITQDSLNIAVAVEIIHSTLLIHDDIMDNDNLRRGKKALFAEYEEKGRLRKTTDPKLYGQSMAICAGDIGFFLSYELMSAVRSGGYDIMRILSRELQYVGAMQMGDVDFGMRDFEPTEEEIISVYRYKTGRYTISLPLILGAKLAQAPDSLISKLDTFGEELGILFQIRDDELSLFGDEAVTGKPIGSDIRENKKTLLRHLLFKHATNSELQFLKHLFGNKSITDEDMKKFRNLYEKSEASKILRDKINTSLRSLHLKIDGMEVGVEWRELLHTFTDYIVVREK